MQERALGEPRAEKHGRQELLVGKREPVEEVLRGLGPETSASNQVWSGP